MAEKDMLRWLMPVYKVARLIGLLHVQFSAGRSQLPLEVSGRNGPTELCGLPSPTPDFTARG